jgi:hypothetical protein
MSEQQTSVAQVARRDLIAGGLAVASSGAAQAAGPRASPIVELRQYTCHAGRRDALIALFEQEFIESQDALGAAVLGTFRDADDPDRFVWLRGFVSMPRRAEALEAFYSGPIWREHRNAANVTMLDSDNVLLLHPSAAGGGFDLAARPPGASGEVLAVLHYMDEGLLAPFTAFFEATMRPQIAADGAHVLASFVSETSANTFPRLPIRERDRVFAWFARPPAAGETAFLERQHRRSGWRDAGPEALLPAFMRKPEVLRLRATARSRLA